MAPSESLSHSQENNGACLRLLLVLVRKVVAEAQEGLLFVLARLSGKTFAAKTIMQVCPCPQRGPAGLEMQLLTHTAWFLRMALIHTTVPVLTACRSTRILAAHWPPLLLHWPTTRRRLHRGP